LLIDGELGQRQVVVLWTLLFVGLLVGRRLARACARVLGPVERCLLVGDKRSAGRLARSLERSPDVKACLVGRVAIEPGAGARGAMGTLEDLEDVILRCEAHRVVIAPGASDSDAMLDLVRRVKSLGVKVSVLPRLFEVVGAAALQDDVNGLTLLAVPRFGRSRSSWLLKRTIDVCGVTLGLIACAPLLALIALWIKWDSPGSVFFAQRRIGRDGEPFEMLKFRTMVAGAEARKDELRALNEASGLFKIAADPRITRAGRFLRRSSLDELPQLLNVLRGEMSLVGPRPLVAEDDERVEGWERKRLYLTPGMTGPWQVLGSSRVPLEEMVKIDYLYGGNWSLWLDVKILLRTLLHVSARRGM
jgi:exopolysaccharide biosynthesis polyprenyl glycosylphosphotransferase